MDKLLKDLCNNLEEQLATYKLLVQYEQDKQQTLIDGNIDQLEELVKKEQQVVYQNGVLEKNRRELIAQLAEELGEPQADLTLSRVVELVEGEASDKLAQLYQDLEYVVVELKDLNIKNNSLIEQSLSYINYSLEVLVGSNQDDPGTYGKPKSSGEDANKSRKSKRSFLDKKI